MGSVSNKKGRVSNNSMESMECDCNKLEEARKTSESSNTLSGLGPPLSLPSPCASEPASSYVSSHSKLSESDEDTEDASEDETQSLKEQVYHERLTHLQDNLDQLKAGTNEEYIKGLRKLDEDLKDRIEKNNASRDYEIELIEREYENQQRLILNELEEKGNEVVDVVVKDLEDQKKQTEQERSQELDSEPNKNEAKPKVMSTRKLRRGIVPMSLPWQRRKTPVSQMKFELDDKDIDEDLKVLANHNLQGAGAVLFQSKDDCPSSEATTDVDDDDRSISPPPPIHFDARIQNGKLFYEKRWFHRGQPVFIEGKNTSKSSGIIGAISHDMLVVWMQMLKETRKLEIPISSIQNGEFVITRRAC
ncbi:unnamed protein product [Orchesella dallaii]|uniref:Sin3 histone deacetylase corepressor complex component SDS3 n=1 Tax=Orchesella dallaii TaxID=48710 RepID=A0ABP1S944_9HEXA